MEPRPSFVADGPSWLKAPPLLTERSPPPLVTQDELLWDDDADLWPSLVAPTSPAPSFAAQVLSHFLPASFGRQPPSHVTPRRRALYEPEPGAPPGDPCGLTLGPQINLDIACVRTPSFRVSYYQPYGSSVRTSDITACSADPTSTLTCLAAIDGMAPDWPRLMSCAPNSFFTGPDYGEIGRVVSYGININGAQWYKVHPNGAVGFTLPDAPLWLENGEDLPPPWVFEDLNITIETFRGLYDPFFRLGWSLDSFRGGFRAGNWAWIYDASYTKVRRSERP